MNFIYIVIWLAVSTPNRDIMLLDGNWNRPYYEKEKASVSSFETKIFSSVDSIVNMQCYQHDPQGNWNYAIGKDTRTPYKIYRQKMSLGHQRDIQEIIDSNNIQEMTVQPFYSYTYDSTWGKGDSGKFIYKDRTESKSFEGFKLYPISSKLEVDDTTIWHIEKPKPVDDTLFCKFGRTDSSKFFKVLTCDTFTLSGSKNWNIDTLYYDKLIMKKAPKKKKEKK